MVKLSALALTLQLFPIEALNIYTGSQYVANIIQPLETAVYVVPISSIQESLLQV